LRAARFFANGVVVEDVEPGALAPGWIRLEVQACGICGSDLHAWSRLSNESGRVPGHEIAARVPESFVGLEPEGAGSLDPVSLAPLRGRLCVVDPRVACGCCDFCRTGSPHLCRSGELIGVTLAGGFAEYVDVPLYNVHPLPVELSMREAIFAEPLAVAIRALAQARLAVETRVLVLGAGTLGLVVAQLARRLSEHVAVVGRHPHQLAAAQTLGVTALSESDADLWAREYEPDVVIETVGGRARTLERAIRCCRSGGRIAVLGLFSESVSLDVRELVVRELELVGSNTYGANSRGTEFATAVAWLPRLAPELRRLVTHVFPLERMRDALCLASDKSAGCIKVCVELDESAACGAPAS